LLHRKKNYVNKYELHRFKNLKCIQVLLGLAGGGLSEGSVWEEETRGYHFEHEWVREREREIRSACLLTCMHLCFSALLDCFPSTRGRECKRKMPRTCKLARQLQWIQYKKQHADFVCAKAFGKKKLLHRGLNDTFHFTLFLY
jgi:hypothetical protein